MHTEGEHVGGKQDGPDMPGHDNVGLTAILMLYMAWFEGDIASIRRFAKGTSEGQSLRSATDFPPITQLEGIAKSLLTDSLPLNIPVQFVLSLIESVAHTTKRFILADRENAQCYRSAALRILSDGLTSKANNHNQHP